MGSIGIRHETKSEWERRVAVTPALAEHLIATGIDVVVERSDRRIFRNEEYEAVGAELVDTLPATDIVIGVKEVPSDLFKAGGNYLFFSHVIKGQSYNMPMLARMLDQGCTLIDYERITNEKGQRLVFFGRHAGLAGMIDALWALGKKCQAQGIATPFSDLGMANDYTSLSDALAVVDAVGDRIATEGVPAQLHPLIIGVAGYGNVGKGVQSILEHLPTVEIAPEDVAALSANPDADNKVIYRVTFKEQHLARTLDGSEFVLQDYYNHPDRFEGDFEQYLPHLSMLMNCIYWTDAYPRLVAISDLPKMTRCRVLGDISCDIRGAVQVTVEATEPGDPVYHYDADNDSALMGFEGTGPVIAAVDILPAELPREASETFTEALTPYVVALANADYSAPFEQLDLPPAMKRAVIVHRGRLTPDYQYLSEYLA